MSQIKVAKAIEEICAQGCTRVSEIIIELEQDSEIQHCKELTEEETVAVLAELKAIMSVYNNDD